MTKLEVRAYLERALRVKTTDVRTSNYDGAKRRDRGGFHRRAAFKKVYVTLGERWFPPEAFRAKDARERDDDARARRASAPRGRIDVSDARGEILRDARRRIATTTTVR